ncbi:hypothetical protein LAT59_00520 [Candidatus Gracilibacteria bacterium]|nr:hypothetical protein [Candidatus Gracilibacteria bacterium]
MKLQQIHIGKNVFSPGDVNSDQFQDVFSQKFISAINNDTLGSIIAKGYEILKKGNTDPLGITEQVTLACFQIKTDIDFILDDSTNFSSLVEKLSPLQIEDIYDILTSCTSQNDLEETLRVLKVEYLRKSDFADAVTIFAELNLKEIKESDLEIICSLLREFEFDGVLLATLENRADRNIRILRRLGTSPSKDVIIELDGETQSPWFYLEGQILLQMKEIAVNGDDNSNKKYYKGITFGGKKGILVTSGDYIFAHVLDITHSVNGNNVIIIDDFHKAGYHLYLPEENMIFHLNATNIDFYYCDINNHRIDENSDDFTEQISDPGVKKIMRVIIDAEKGYFYDFNGEEFGKLKIQTTNLLLGYNAQSTLH